MGIIAKRLAVELYGRIKETIKDKYSEKKNKSNHATEDVQVRMATLEDAPVLLDIYRYYVEETAISYEYTTPDLEVFRQRMESILVKYPYFVAIKDNKILGYAYAGPFVGRAAYQWSAELTIYLEKNERNAGVGRVLYDSLENALEKMGIQNLYACIGYPKQDDEYMTKNSAQFHEHMGFKKVGEFYNSGTKFGRWYTMIWMEKIIGTHPDEIPVLKNYSEIAEEQA